MRYIQSSTALQRTHTPLLSFEAAHRDCRRFFLPSALPTLFLALGVAGRPRARLPLSVGSPLQQDPKALLLDLTVPPYSPLYSESTVCALPGHLTLPQRVRKFRIECVAARSRIEKCWMYVWSPREPSLSAITGRTKAHIKPSGSYITGTLIQAASQQRRLRAISYLYGSRRERRIA
jgi:hypothetical protein